jgi:parvulin-like peptidyl-prolyl isomerase
MRSFPRPLSPWLILALAALLAPAAAPALDAAPARKPAAPGSPPAKSEADAPAPEQKPGEAAPLAPAPVVALRLPLLDDRFASTPVAVVGEEVMTMRDLGDALATSHQDRKKAKAAAVGSGNEFQAILERIVDMRLIVLEAREMGLDQLPEVAQSIASFRERTLRAVLKQQVVADAKADPEKAETIYRDMIREYRVLSLFFDKKEDAEKLPDLLAGGKKLEEVAKQLIAEKKAKGDGVPHDVPAAVIAPPIRIALESTQAGALTAPIATGKGFVVARLDEVKYPENADKRAAAAEEAQVVAEKERWTAFFYGLAKKSLKRDDKLVKAVDFEAKKPGFEALKKDRRVIAQIKGGKPITVGALAVETETTFFHGIQQGIDEKRVNEQKWKSLDKLVYNQVLDQEAARRKIAETEAYRREVEQYTRSVLFGTFVQRAILPDVKVQEEEVQKYYEAHKAEFTYPGFYKLEAVAFASAKPAQAALDRLKAGTDLKWLRANVEGQLRGEDRALQLDGSTFAANSLPPALAQSLTNAVAGDYRLFSFGNQYYAIGVLEVTPPKAQPIDEVKADILKKLMDEHTTASVKDWGEKLRKVHATRIFVTQIEG